MLGWYNQLMDNIKAGDVKTHNEKLWEPSTWPKLAKGVGYMEAPRGALAHWIVIRMARSTITRRWYRVPGTPDHAIRRE